MSSPSVARWLLVCVVAVALAGWNTAATTEPDTDNAIIESGYEANNLGVGWLEQFNYRKAAEQFQEALRLAPSLGIARFNLALAYFYDSQPDLAEREARVAARLMPGAPQPQFLLGLVARAQNRVSEAAAAFTRVLQIDPEDVGANIGLGQVRLQQGDAAGAATVFERAVHADPANATATYNLSISLTRAGHAEEGRRMLERFQVLRESGTATTLGSGYLQQGQYAEAILSTGAEPHLVSGGTPHVTFADEPFAVAAPPPAGTRRAPATDGGYAASLEGGVAAIDADDDGDLDVLEVAPDRERLWSNDGSGHFTARPAPPFLRPRGAIGVGAVAGDVTNDGRPDVLVLRLHGTTLYRNEGGGRFTDVTAATGLRLGDDLPATAALVDADHDGDLDILIGGLVSLARPPTGAGANTARQFPDQFPAAAARLFRNDGNGHFTDVTKASSIAASRLVGIVPTDYDLRRDVDLLTISRAAPLRLFRNLRDGTFADMAGSAGVPESRRWTAVTAGDLNKDGRTDFYLGCADAPGAFVISAAPGRFQITAAPASTSGTRAALFLDYDNDGQLDLLASTAGGTRLLRNLGASWLDVTDRALPAARTAAVLPTIAGGRVLLGADLDRDGDTDIAVRYGGTLHLWRNEGGNAQRSFAMRLAGRVSNRGGTGAAIELRAGRLRERRETTAVTPPTGTADLVFGLGARRRVNVVRVLWPSGILQAEVAPAETKRPAVFTELDRKPSSCPFLFTWDGSRFQFISDFLGGGELGYWVAPGVRGEPDPDEVVRIAAERLRPRDGRYELRVTNELEEVLFLDTARLQVVDHPNDVEVFPDEGLVSRPRAGMRLVAVRDISAPAAVFGDRGGDVSALVASQDFRAADEFRPASVRGYAEPHALTITPRTGTHADWLLLSGWTDYAYSSDNVAAWQSGLHLAPPVIDARDASGRWRETTLEVPVPAGRPQTVLVDLRSLRAGGARAFRIRTNMRIHWDQVRLARAADDIVLRTRELPQLSATLRARGFSRERTSAPGGPLVYDYDLVSRVSPWKQFVGPSTPEGSVTRELASVDDRFVVAVTGDEIALSFDAGRMSPPAPGQARTFLLHADGFSKEMDVHSASPDTIGPLPYHGMRAYPPPAPRVDASADAASPSRARRTVRSVPSIESLLVGDSPSSGHRRTGSSSSSATPNREAHR